MSRKLTAIQIRKYLEVKELMEAYRDKERKMRIELIEKLHGEDSEPGTYNYDAYGYKVKIKMSDNVTFDHKSFLHDEPKLNTEEMLCIDYKPVIDMRKFNQLADDSVPTLLEYVTYKPAMPVLSIEEIDEDLV